MPREHKDYEPVITIALPDGSSLLVWLAMTPQAQHTGLLNKTAMAPDHGMLFVFQDCAPRVFSTFDMRFAIDIIALGPDGNVVYVYADAKPGYIITLPDCCVVLETVAGVAVEHGLAVGHKVSCNPYPPT